MIKDIKTIHLLLIEPSSNKAEAIINTLRNQGYAVRATQILTSDDLSNALEKGVSDLILANLTHQELPAKQAIQQISDFGRDIPCIVLMQEFDEKVLSEAMQYGARDGVSIDSLGLLTLKIKRELSSLESRRKKTQTELALKATEKRCTLLLDNSQDAIAYVHEGMHVYANKAYMELFDYEDNDELMCVPVLDAIASDNQEEFRQYLKNMSAAGEQQSFSFMGVKSNMEQFDAIMTLSTANYDDEVCTQLLIRLPEDNTELEAKLKELSSLDSLTNLYNKVYFNEQLQKVIESVNEKAKTYSLIYIKYDQYSKLLSEYGLAGVDQMTQDCAKWLSENIAENDTLARIGDNSFSFIIEDSSAKKAKNMAEDFCQKINEELFDIQGITIKLTFSIGICSIADSRDDASKVLSDALSACNRVENGNGIKVFSKAIDSAASDADVKLLEIIQESIESGKAHLLYQPIVKLHGEMSQLYEARICIPDKDGNPLNTEEALKVMKSANLITKLDRWVIRQVAKELKLNKLDGNTQVFVKLSSNSLIDQTLVSFIDKLFAAAQIKKSSVIFQFDEADAINHLKRVIELSADLAKRGYALCLAEVDEINQDTNLIEQLDCDYVKISHKKSQKIYQDSEVAEKIQEIIELSHEKDKLTIIPGVEEAAMLAALWPMNVKYIQGHYLQKPVEKMNYDFSSSGF
jgi:diguanylate cyclase (GGDEF)-like protein